MASKQSEAIRQLYNSRLTIPAQHDDWSIRDQQEMIEGWNVLTTEPGDVDYLEIRAGSRRALWAIPHDAPTDRALFCIHGGGFIAGSIYTHRKLFAHLAKAVGARALIVDYRLLPDGAYPAAVSDTLAAYRWLLEQGVAANRVVFAADSSGGYLALATQFRARAEGLPLPVATTLLSPWVDLEGTGETIQSNNGKDALFTPVWVSEMARNFLGEHSLRDPNVNALYADLTGLGALYIQVGDQELLLDDSRRLAERARNAGVDTRLDVFPEMQHTFQMMAGRAPEANDAIDRLATWLRPKLGLADRAHAA